MATTRKLNKVRNSYYVYLPKEWCVKFNLNEKSEIKIQQNSEGTLTIFPPHFGAKSSDDITFDVADVGSDAIESILIGSYIVGTRKIVFKFSDTIDMETRETISRWIRRLPGFEIFEEQSSRLTISDTSEKQVVLPVLKRQFATTKYMLNGLVSLLKGADSQDAPRIIDRDEDVDRHRYFVERLCHLALQNPSYARRIDITPADCLHFSLAAKYVERIADHICGATNEIAEMESAELVIMRVSESLKDIYDKTTRTFFSIDGSRTKEPITSESKEAFEVLEAANRIANKLARHGSSKRGTDSHAVLLTMHLERIASYCADIGEVAVNRIIESNVFQQGSDVPA